MREKTLFLPTAENDFMVAFIGDKLEWMLLAGILLLGALAIAGVWFAKRRR